MLMVNYRWNPILAGKITISTYVHRRKPTKNIENPGIYLMESF